MTNTVVAHPFDAAIHLEPDGPHRFRGATSPAYANMVGPFGGITCAALLNAVLAHPDRQGDPVALTVNFAGPVADGPFTIEARPARTNRSTQHWIVQLEQQGGIATTGTVVTAVRRQTWSASDLQAPRELPAADLVARADPVGRPAWTRRYDMRFIEGDFPAPLDGIEQDGSLSRLWIRDEPPRPLDFPSLAAISDNFFPRILIRRRRFVPFGTVSLTTYFHADVALLAAQGTQHLLGVARALNYRNGFFDQSAQVWGVDATLLATAHQVVYYRE